MLSPVGMAESIQRLCCSPPLFYVYISILISTAAKMGLAAALGFDQLGLGIIPGGSSGPLEGLSGLLDVGTAAGTVFGAS